MNLVENTILCFECGHCKQLHKEAMDAAICEDGHYPEGYGRAVGYLNWLKDQQEKAKLKEAAK